MTWKQVRKMEREVESYFSFIGHTTLLNLNAAFLLNAVRKISDNRERNIYGISEEKNVLFVCVCTHASLCVFLMAG